MKLLKDLLYRCGIERIQGTTQMAISHVAFDSRKVQKDSLFVAISGTQNDGHNHIYEAIEKGACAVVVETWQESLPSHIVQVEVKNSAKALGAIASNFYEQPSEYLKVVAVTGTNGKTTVASLLHKLALDLGYKAGLISTVVHKVSNEEITSTHTTPDALQLQQLFKRMRDAGCAYVFMEASSHGIVQERMAGISLTGAIFTNISRDHLDYHGTFNHYVAAKKKLFDDLPASAFALSNLDDKQGNHMLLHSRAKKLSFALQQPADFKGKVLESDFNGMLLDFNGEEFWTGLIGHFNASNLLAIYSAALTLNLAKSQELLAAMSLLKPVAGRFQYLHSKKGVTGIVDYAHTPDALENVCSTITQIIEKGRRLFVVVGCGGNRDAGKRPIMAQIAVKYGNRSVFTADNPRFEDPEDILDQMEAGLDLSQRSRVFRIADRKEAIKTACHLAEMGDVVLIAGKGHESYQEIQGIKHPFSDLEVLRSTFENMPE